MADLRGCVKGAVLVSRMAFVRARAGDFALKSVLARLPLPDRALLTGGVLSAAWYPFETNERLDASVAREFGGDAIYRVLGAQSAADALGGDLKRFVTLRDAQGILRHVAELHGLYKDSGYMTYDWVSRTSATIRTFDCKSFSFADCLTNLGWHEKAIELCGGLNVHTAETRCRAKGERLCEYQCAWDMPRGSTMPPPA